MTQSSSHLDEPAIPGGLGRTLFIMNPMAGSVADQASVEALAARIPGSTLVQTEHAGHARDLAWQAALAGVQTLVATGGDGTINEVVTGIIQSGAVVTLGLLPMGTGNDLARTLAIPLDPELACGELLAGRRRRIDVIEMTLADGSIRYGVNAAVGGAPTEVGARLDAETKSWWGKLAYVQAGLSVLANLSRFTTRILWEEREVEEVTLLGAVVANGRTAAGGWRCAPHADPEDGLLDVLIVRDGSGVEIVDAILRYVGGNFDASTAVDHRKVRSVSFMAKEPMGFNIDGELITTEPVRFRVLPAALSILVGEGYTPTGG